MSHEREAYFHHEKEQHPAEKPVLVGGRFLGREIQSLVLADLMPSQLGSDGYKEIWFETVSGNIYRIYMLDSNNLALIDAKSNMGRENNLHGVVISSHDAHYARLETGSCFASGPGATTTKVRKIIAVTSKQFHTGTSNRQAAKEIADRETEGNISDIQERFNNYLKPKSKR